METKVKPPILFHIVRPFRLPGRRALQELLRKLMERENTAFERLEFIFCDDAFLLDINIRYLDHHDLTDIITFNLAEPGQPAIGEIYISVDRVKENAVSLEVPFLTELHRVMIHGALHLVGYKDATAQLKAEMRAKEDEYLRLLEAR